MASHAQCTECTDRASRQSGQLWKKLKHNHLTSHRPPPGQHARLCRLPQPPTLRDFLLFASGHALHPSRMLVNITLSTWARARASRWFKHLFQAWKAPRRGVCLRRRWATVRSSRAVRYLQGGTLSYREGPGGICSDTWWPARQLLADTATAGVAGSGLGSCLGVKGLELHGVAAQVLDSSSALHQLQHEAATRNSALCQSVEQGLTGPLGAVEQGCKRSGMLTALQNAWHTICHGGENLPEPTASHLRSRHTGHFGSCPSAHVFTASACTRPGWATQLRVKAGISNSHPLTAHCTAA